MHSPKTARDILSRLSRLRPKHILRRRRISRMSTRQVFVDIYEKQRWESSESVSGSGSTQRATQSIRSGLPALLDELGVRSMLDAPCGDFAWMQGVELPVDKYIGADIVPAMVKKLINRYGNDKRTFVLLDIIEDPLPNADLFFCRDCMIHLDLRKAVKVLENFKRSNCTYMLASTYTETDHNRDIVTGEARPLNLCRPPFNLPDPLRLVEDTGTIVVDKAMGLWRRDQLNG